MGIEIERKFLVDHDKWEKVEKPEGTLFKQGYIINESNRTVRIRVAGDKGYITLKGGTSGVSRSEHEYEVPVSEGLELLDIFAITMIEKKRYCIVYEDKTWEIDEFSGDNAGLIIAEIELDTEDEAFETPGWVTEEVSDDARYFNSNLSTHPFKDWGNADTTKL